MKLNIQTDDRRTHSAWTSATLSSDEVELLESYPRLELANDAHKRRTEALVPVTLVAGIICYISSLVGDSYVAGLMFVIMVGSAIGYGFGELFVWRNNKQRNKRLLAAIDKRDALLSNVTLHYYDELSTSGKSALDVLLQVALRDMPQDAALQFADRHPDDIDQLLCADDVQAALEQLNSRQMDWQQYEQLHSKLHDRIKTRYMELRALDESYRHDTEVKNTQLIDTLDRSTGAHSDISS